MATNFYMLIIRHLEGLFRIHNSSGTVPSKLLWVQFPFTDKYLKGELEPLFTLFSFCFCHVVDSVIDGSRGTLLEFM